MNLKNLEAQGRAKEMGPSFFIAPGPLFDVAVDSSGSAVRALLCAGAFVFTFLAGSPIAAAEREKYEIINTGIQAAAGCWYDSGRFVVLRGKQVAGTSTFEAEGIFYFDVTKPIRLQRVDLRPIEPAMQKRIHSIFCKDGSIVFNLPGSAPADPSVAKLYAVQIGKPLELIAEMRGVYPASKSVNLKGRYVVGNKRKMANGVFEGQDECGIVFHKADFKVLCWDTYGRNAWPLSQYVLTESRWRETIRVKGEDGQVRTVKNPEPPLLGKDGKPRLHAYLMKSLEGEIIGEPSFADRRFNRRYVSSPDFPKILSPDEKYLYYPCSRLGDHDLKYTIYDRVCRVSLDLDQPGAEEVFSVFQEKNNDILVSELSVGKNGDVYFAAKGSKRIRGIWKYTATTGAVAQLTRPPSHGWDTVPQVSLDGMRVAFVRPEAGAYKLFIAQRKGTTK